MRKGSRGSTDFTTLRKISMWRVSRSLPCLCSRLTVKKLGAGHIDSQAWRQCIVAIDLRRNALRLVRPTRALLLLISPTGHIAQACEVRKGGSYCRHELLGAVAR